MLTRVCFYVALLVTVPIFPQVVSPVNPAPDQGNDQMATPPPVSGVAFPTAVGAEERSNYLRAEMTFVTSYIDNIYPGNGRPLAETTFSILPTIDLDQTTPIRHAIIRYSPGFTFYKPTGTLNEVDQSAIMEYGVRLSPHSLLRVNDEFQYSSTSFGSAVSGIGGAVSGSAQTVTPGIIAPFAQRLTNNVVGEFSLQTGRSSMIGGSGMASTLHYPNPSEVSGLSDSSSRGGYGFYNRQISSGLYIGAMDGYTKVVANPPNGKSETDLQSLAGFFTLYPRQTLSVSVTGGPQYYRVSGTDLPATSSWAPSLLTSIGWQGLHTSFAAIYSQEITAGGGLDGAFRTKNAGAAGRWQMSRSWTIGAGADYAINKSVTPLITGDENGHSVGGWVRGTYSINQRVSVDLEYDRLHQSYQGIQAVSSNPDSDRVAVSLSWQLMRPIGH